MYFAYVHVLRFLLRHLCRHISYTSYSFRYLCAFNVCMFYSINTTFYVLRLYAISLYSCLLTYIHFAACNAIFCVFSVYAISPSSCQLGKGAGSCIAPSATWPANPRAGSKNCVEPSEACSLLEGLRTKMCS